MKFDIFISLYKQKLLAFEQFEPNFSWPKIHENDHLQFGYEFLTQNVILKFTLFYKNQNILAEARCSEYFAALSLYVLKSFLINIENREYMAKLDVPKFYLMPL